MAIKEKKDGSAPAWVSVRVRASARRPAHTDAASVLCATHAEGTPHNHTI